MHYSPASNNRRTDVTNPITATAASKRSEAIPGLRTRY
jgi:hypothetical protein